MKYKLPRFSCAASPDVPRWRVESVLIALALATLFSSLQPSAASAQLRQKRSGYGTSSIAAEPDHRIKETALTPPDRAGEGGEPLPAPLIAEEKVGNSLVALAAKDVFRQKAIQAKVRQRVFAFGQEVAGAGEYYQFGSGQPKLLRLDMKMQVGPQAATLLQVCGRQDYWIRRHVPPGNPKLEHVNLTRLASALSHQDDTERHVPTENWILLGGLSRLVETLHRNFDFAPPQEARIGKLPVLVVHGRLKPARVESLRPVGDQRREAAAEQLPTAVNLTLGRADQLLPHFPYRVEFLRQLSPTELKATATGNTGESTTETALSILEFYEVQAPLELDPQLFEFDPGDEEFEDRTQTWLRKMQE